MSDSDISKRLASISPEKRELLRRKLLERGKAQGAAPAEGPRRSGAPGRFLALLVLAGGASGSWISWIRGAPLQHSHRRAGIDRPPGSRRRSSGR